MSSMLSPSQFGSQAAPAANGGGANFTATNYAVSSETSGGGGSASSSSSSAADSSGNTAPLSADQFGGSSSTDPNASPTGG